MTDSAFWVNAKFSYETDSLVMALALFDGSKGQLDEIRLKYDIVLSRIGTIANSDLSPKLDDAYKLMFSRVREELQAMEPRLDALRGGDVAQVRALAFEARRLAVRIANLASLELQSDSTYRQKLAIAVMHAHYAFAAAALALVCSFFCMLRALVRQARVLEQARTQLRLAVDKAQAGTRAKSAFLATMSHEIRTPMNGVLGAASLLAQTKLTDPQRRSVEIVKTCGEALMAQLDDVLDFSALEAERIDLHPELCDVRAWVDETCRVMEPAAGQKRIDIATVVDPDVPQTLITDHRRLRQVVLNLVSNAIKFTAQGGVVVRVSLRQSKPTASLRIAVADTGPGVARADRSRVFEEFTRLGQGGEPGPRGTGLGLAISRRIVCKMQGSIGVTGITGAGSVFILRVPVSGLSAPPQHRPHSGTAAVIGGVALVRRALERNLRSLGYVLTGSTAATDIVLAHGSLPNSALPSAPMIVRFGAASLTDRETAAARWLQGVASQTSLQSAITLDRHAAPPPATVPRLGRVLSLLVADDDPVSREVEASMLRYLGHRVTTVTNGDDALAALRAHAFDCAFLDRHMPGLHGEDIAHHVRLMSSPAAALRRQRSTARRRLSSSMRRCAAPCGSVFPMSSLPRWCGYSGSIWYARSKQST